jgi:hypothetical protein
MRRIPTLDDYVQAHLTDMQAPLKRATVFGPSGRWVQRRTGERIVLAPDGVTKLRVVSYVDGGTAVEHGNDTRHAVVRPAPQIIKLTTQ